MFGVGFGGRLSAKPAVNAEPGTVPFAISFDPFGHLVIAEAGTNALAAFQLSRNGTVSLLDRTPTGQAATCWVTPAGSFLFASNAGTPSESGFTSSASGQLTLLGNTAIGPVRSTRRPRPAAGSCTYRPAATASSTSSAWGRTAP